MRFSNPEFMAAWPAPNLVNPVLRGPELYIINSIFAFAATLCVGLRFYLRIFERRWFGLDDWLLAFAYICMLGDVAVVLWGVSHGSCFISCMLRGHILMRLQ
jgi:hypothetical protein